VYEFQSLSSNDVANHVIVFPKPERNGPKIVVSYFKVIFLYSIAGAEKNYETLSQNDLYLDQDLNLASFGFKSGTFTA
jgi:hypothetical protein